MFGRFLILKVGMILVLLSSASAMDMTGRYSLGFFNTEVPVGGRYWAASNIAIDLGFGFDICDEGDDTYTDFYIGAGFPYVVVDMDRANFFVRPGVVVGMLDARPYGIDSEIKWTKINISLMPGAEVFFGESFSLEAAHGLEVELISYPDEDEFGALAGESRTNFRSLGRNFTHLGFHFYFR